MAPREKARPGFTGVRDIISGITHNRIIPGCAILLVVACGGPRNAGVEDLSGRANLSRYKLESLRGVRDGDHLEAHARFSDGAVPLLIDLHFAVGPRTALRTGEWRWERNGAVESGTVRARSVTFLGGQSGPPSIGGRFDLLSPEGVARYRVTIPVRELIDRR